MDIFVDPSLSDIYKSMGAPATGGSKPQLGPKRKPAPAGKLTVISPNVERTRQERPKKQTGGPAAAEAAEDRLTRKLVCTDAHIPCSPPPIPHP